MMSFILIMVFFGVLHVAVKKYANHVWVILRAILLSD